MTHTHFVILAYVVIAALLWGYAALLFLQTRSQRDANPSPTDSTP
jgi:hypothetical protein